MMSSWRLSVKNFWLTLILVIVFCAGCRPNSSQSKPTYIPATVVTTLIPTVVPSITPIPKPLAAKVNGEGILLDEFKGEVQRFNDSNKDGGAAISDPEISKKVLNDLIGLTLLAQAAQKTGHIINGDQLQARMDQIAAQIGGMQALKDWISRNHYSDETFGPALKRSMEAAWQRDQIAAQVPNKVEQVHARQILVTDENLANEIYQQLQSGADFASLAHQYDPLTNGDLGWFPRKYLTQPGVEDAVFSLNPGKYSSVIKSEIGYHIIMLLERDPAHPLSPEARRVVVRNAVSTWIEQQRTSSQIDILIPEQ